MKFSEWYLSGMAEQKYGSNAIGGD